MRESHGANRGAAFVRDVLARLERAVGPAPPWRLEEPVACLVGTILAQATNDGLAERAFRALRRRFPSWRAVLAAPRAEVEAAVRVSGLGAQKARAIQAFLGHLQATRGRITLADLRRPGLDVDAALAELSGIPGVGVKTAAITLMFGAGASLCAVDTHLVRVLRRLGVVPPRAAPERAFRLLRPLVPDGRGVELHLQLLRFGRTICHAARPRCWACPLAARCPFPDKTPDPSTAPGGRIPR
jgi:endonuclease-3